MTKTLSLLLKATIVVGAIVGVVLSHYNARGFMGGNSTFLYFTIQSNLWIAILDIVALAMMARGGCSRRWYSLAQLIFTVSITLTGVVFCFVLAPTMAPGTAFGPANVLTHVVVPVAAVIDFVVCRKSYTFQRKDALFPTLPALYYLGFASIGYVLDWPFGEGVNYPYFFLNWGSPVGAFGFSNEFPFMGVVYYIAAILVFLITLSSCYIALCPKDVLKPFTPNGVATHD